MIHPFNRVIGPLNGGHRRRCAARRATSVPAASGDDGHAMLIASLIALGVDLVVVVAVVVFVIGEHHPRTTCRQLRS